MMAWIASVLAAAFLLHGAWWDLHARRIPNRSVLATALTAPLWHLAAGTPLPALAGTAACAIFALITGIVLWRRGLVGGGDVKFLAATMLLARPAVVPEVLLVTALVGGLLALLLLARRMFAAHPLVLLAASHPLVPVPLARALTGCSGKRASVPYGVAIAAGGLVALAGDPAAL